ncbi:MAG: zf-HC2 domain-containing protein, partial [Bacteroidales bacterium]|nr:zf-HC2 domain-containing protein [Bacteroidales bacterium]
MNCQELVELISEFLDGELAAEQRVLVEQHLCGCRDCHVSLELYQATIRVTRALGR